MKKYIKKPIAIEAIQLTQFNFDEICNFVGYTLMLEYNPDFRIDNFDNIDCPYIAIFIKTLEGDMKASIGDYIIKGVKGEFYPCKQDIFEETYDLVDTINEKSEFKDTVRPLIKYLAEKHHPHTTAIVTSTRAELLEGVECFETEDYLID